MRSQRNTVRWSAALLSIVVGLGVASCGSDTPTNPTPGPTADLTITILGQNGAASFSSNSGITEGQTVAWKNTASDNNTHTATATGVFNTGDIVVGATSAPITLNTAGDYPYVCSRHPGTMSGTLTVKSHVVTIVANSGDQSYSPNPLVITVGQSVVWKNLATGGETHSAVADGATFDTGAIVSGATSTKIVFNTAGTFSYHCFPHTSMVGTITVNPATLSP